ncbi:MAG TPA: trypsin-like peptidase domain-containing protein [Caulobacteraceae bacterium]|nr:trypsin-like peptidase domain-containing protein [Caulobacteraceae bacterium]
MPRLPDWLIYLGVVLVLSAASFGRREQVNAPAPPPPVPGADQAPISPASPFAEATLVHIGGGRANRGTAFAVADRVWLTAASAVAGCGKPAIVVADGWAAPAKVLGRAGDVAVLGAEDGAPALGFAKSGRPAPSARGFVAGFSRGTPGEAATIYLGNIRSRLAWAEIGRTDGLKGPLFGFAGAPMLDASGVVAGMVIGDAPRRGLVTAATPAELTAALATAGRKAGGADAPQPITRDNYGRAADVLRRATSVVAVDCL